jgi:hypothetical protein
MAESRQPNLRRTSTMGPMTTMSRVLSLRSFDAQALMIDAAVVPGNELAETLDRFFDNDDCDHVHVHNASRGCRAVRVEHAV